MTEQTMENQVCRACGADIRPGALFCYGCGSAVAIDENSAKHVGVIEKPIVKPIEKPVGIPIENLSETKNNDLVNHGKSSLNNVPPRPKPKVSERKTIEVVWEPAENTPNIWFIVVALILTLFAVGALLAMLYIR